MTVLFLALSAFAAEYGPTLEGAVPAFEPAAVEDTGVVGCSDQYLEEGELLPELPLFYTRAQPNHSWGTPDMISLLVETGRHMRWLMPTASPLVIGDISWERGGFLSGHVSHRGGIDVDIGIYERGGVQNPRAFADPGSAFDLEANWALISAMLDSERVDFILLDQSHINRLRSYTLSRGLLTDEEAEDVFPNGGRLWEKTGIVRHAPNHQDHLHVRVLCSDGTRAR